ncbi:MAG: hypothetical protein AB7J63_18945 [Vicinamibacterales bacterium]
MVSEISSPDGMPTVPDTLGDPDVPDEGQRRDADAAEDAGDEPGYGYGV